MKRYPISRLILLVAALSAVVGLTIIMTLPSAETLSAAARAQLSSFLPVVFAETGGPTPTATPVGQMPTHTATPMPTATEVPTETPLPTATINPCAFDPANILLNPDFEDGEAEWVFRTNGIGLFSAEAPAYTCNLAAKLAIDKQGSATQLMQTGFELDAGSLYELSFAAYSESGNDLRADLLRNSDPYTNYGLSETFNLTTAWQTFTVTFTTQRFSGTVDDARFRFFLFESDDNVYWIDHVKLVKVADFTPTPTATSPATATTTPTLIPTATPTLSVTVTPSPTSVAQATATATNVATGTPTSTKVATGTPTPTKVATSTPTPTKVATPMPTPTATKSATPTATSTPVPTAVSTATATATPPSQPTATPTSKVIGGSRP